MCFFVLSESEVRFKTHRALLELELEDADKEGGHTCTSDSGTGSCSTQALSPSRDSSFRSKVRVLLLKILEHLDAPGRPPAARSCSRGASSLQSDATTCPNTHAAAGVAGAARVDLGRGGGGGDAGESVGGSGEGTGRGALGGTGGLGGALEGGVEGNFYRALLALDEQVAFLRSWNRQLKVCICHPLLHFVYILFVSGMLYCCNRELQVCF